MKKMIYCDRSDKSVHNGMNYGRGRLEWLLVRRLWKSNCKINGKGSTIPGVTSKSKEWGQREDRNANSPKGHEIS